MFTKGQSMQHHLLQCFGCKYSSLWFTAQNFEPGTAWTGEKSGLSRLKQQDNAFSTPDLVSKSCRKATRRMIPEMKAMTEILYRHLQIQKMRLSIYGTVILSFRTKKQKRQLFFQLKVKEGHSNHWYWEQLVEILRWKQFWTGYLKAEPLKLWTATYRG